MQRVSYWTLRLKGNVLTRHHTAAAWATADDANFATFKKLVDSYEKEFRQPESDFDSGVVPQ